MALTAEELFSCGTLTTTWNYHFGGVDTFYTARFTTIIEPWDIPRRRPERAAATAPEAWKYLWLHHLRRCCSS